MASETIIILVFFPLLLHYVLFILKIYHGLGKLNNKKPEDLKHPFVSVIIPFRNESANILASLDSIKNQDYPDEYLEVIYVDDSSDDDSLTKITSAEKSANIKILSVKENNFPAAYKKRAVTLAIENTKGEIILTTDADCIHKTGWVKAMVAYFDQNTAMVSGPVEFSGSNSLFEKIQQLEFRGLILAGAGLIGSGKPVTCSAANLAYRRSVFFEVGGFNDNLDLTSGDDELLMQKISRTEKYEIKFSISGESLVRTFANKTMDDFFNQRKRWASKSIFYKDKWLVFRLMLVFFFYLGIFISIAGSFFSPFFIPLFFLSIAGKVIPEYLVMKRGEERIYKTRLLKYFLITEVFQLIYILTAAFAGLFGNLKWKGRIVRR